jgi:thiol-disulfide isomerase/thioredoxin
MKNITILFSLALVLQPLAFAQNTPAPAAFTTPVAFATALADFNAERARITVAGVALTTDVIAVNEAFLGRIDLEALGPQEIAAIVRSGAFHHGDKAHALARSATGRLTAFVSGPDADGALAAALRLRLSGDAGIAAPVRAEWASDYLHHPALVTLLRGEFGDLALDAACGAARTDADKEFVLGLARQLEATRSPAATLAISTYWDNIRRLVPESERRQALRGRLADYLAAALVSGKEDARILEYREMLENTLALLNGAAARGQLQGGPAPEIHFAWSSREGWKKLSDLRGKVVVLDFWATWCGPCVAALPKIAELVGRYRDCEVEFVGVTSVQGSIVGLRSGGTVDCKEDPEKEMRLMADYIKERAITWPVVFSREPVFNPDYGVRGIPTVVVIAPDGTVRHNSMGFSAADEIKQIDTLLAEFHLHLPTPVDAKPNLL